MIAIGSPRPLANCALHLFYRLLYAFETPASGLLYMLFLLEFLLQSDSRKVITFFFDDFKIPEHKFSASVRFVFITRICAEAIIELR